MSVPAIVLIVLGAIVLTLLVGGFVANARRTRQHADEYARHLAEADHALEEARAADRGWDRVLLEEAARKAVAEQRPDFGYDRLDLVLVDDRPGVTDDRAHFVAAGDRTQVRVVLTRREGGEWMTESVE